MQTKRLGYLDFIKGVAMIMVVFCHRVLIPQESVLGTICIMLICSAVPCFMMCSGYVLLFKQESAGRSFRRAAHVYGSMVIWKALYLLYFQLFGPIQFTPVQLIRYLFLFCSMEGVETEHLWFLQAYLPALLIAPLFAPMFCERKYGMVAAFAGLAYLSNQFLMSANLMVDLLSSHLGFEAFDLEMLTNVFPFGGEYSSMLVCFLLGGVYRLLDEKEITQKPWFVSMAALLVVGGLGGMLCVRYLQMGSFAWRGTLLVAQYEWSSTLLMSFGMFGLLRRIGESRPALWLGRHVGCHSMGIYYLHYPCLIPLALYLYPHLTPALWMNFVKTALVVVVCVILVKLAKKVPFLREWMR